VIVGSRAFGLPLHRLDHRSSPQSWSSRGPLLV